MRVVIYDAEGMEPITVIRLPAFAQEMLAEIESGRRPPTIAFPVPGGVSAYGMDAKEDLQRALPLRVCTLRFEPIMRGRDRLMWLCTTHDGESALLLRSVFLPGQTAAVNEARKEAFMDGLMAAMGAR